MSTFNDALLKLIKKLEEENKLLLDEIEEEAERERVTTLNAMLQEAYPTPHSPVEK